MIRPGNFFPLLPATARSGLNDRTIRPQRPHNSAATTARFSPNVCRPPQRSSEGFFPSPSSSSAGKEKRLRAFLKTFRALRENISANETKRFGVFRRPGNGFPLRRQRTDCRPPASSSFPDHAGSFQKRETGRTAILYINTTFFQL